MASSSSMLFSRPFVSQISTTASLRSLVSCISSFIGWIRTRAATWWFIHMDINIESTFWCTLFDDCPAESWSGRWTQIVEWGCTQTHVESAGKCYSYPSSYSDFDQTVRSATKRTSDPVSLASVPTPFSITNASLRETFPNTSQSLGGWIDLIGQCSEYKHIYAEESLSSLRAHVVRYVKHRWKNEDILWSCIVETLIIALGPGFSKTSDQTIDEHLHSHSVHHFGALEYDETYLYQRSSSLQTDTMTSQLSLTLPEQWNIPTPMPLNIAVVDEAIILFSCIFSRTPDKHRLQVLQHFLEIIKHTKGARQETVQLNVLTAVSMALKRCAETKPLIPIDHEHCKKLLCTLIMSNVCHSNALLRCVAGETLARLVQISNDDRFRADLAQYCLDRLKEARDLPARAGYCLALGCLYRYREASHAGQCLHLSIPILLAFAQDASTSGVQVWALHALTLGAHYAGHLFRQQIECITAQILRLLLTLPSYQSDVFSCCARLLISLIKIISSELQMNTISISTIRSSFLTVSQLLQSQPTSAVKAESMHVLQQLHLSAPRHVNLSRLIPELIQSLTHEDLLVKRASVTCLKQLSQREAKEVCQYAREDLSSRISEHQSLEGLFDLYQSIIMIIGWFRIALRNARQRNRDSIICESSRDTSLSTTGIRHTSSGGLADIIENHSGRKRRYDLLVLSARALTHCQRHLQRTTVLSSLIEMNSLRSSLPRLSSSVSLESYAWNNTRSSSCKYCIDHRVKWIMSHLSNFINSSVSLEKAVKSCNSLEFLFFEHRILDKSSCHSRSMNIPSVLNNV